MLNMGRRNVIALAFTLLALGAGASVALAAGVIQWGSEGRGAGQFGMGREDVGGPRQFNDPGGIAIDRAGNPVVTDPSNNRIEVFGPSGSFIRMFGRHGFDPGAASSAAMGQYNLPQGIAIDASGNYYVADNRNDRVVKSSPTGRFLARIGRRGSVRGDFVGPWSVAVHGGVLYVTDQGNYRIEKFSLGGRFLGQFGSFGDSPGHFLTPWDVKTDAAGNVFVSDLDRNKVLRFRPNGAFVSEFGTLGSGPGQLNEPEGLAFDAANHLFVVDAGNRRVESFQADGTFLREFDVGTSQRTRSPDATADPVSGPSFIAIDRASGATYIGGYRQVIKLG
jgi:DNA-binding beta-propeller fold protein YncE